MEDNTIEEGDTNKDIEVAPALIAVHPTQKYVSVAVGSDLRVFSFEERSAVSLADESGGQFHKDSIRAIRYSANGQLFVSAGDDKLVKIWWTESWRCICNVFSEKRVTAVAISNNCQHVCFADKFGVIWVMELDEIDGNQALVNKKAASMLSHYCSIITSLEFSPDGRFIVSADRDFKIRITVIPKKPLHGAHEIQSFCLGHTEFVSCLAFICTPKCPQGRLISGSGDSTVRLWDMPSGSLLDTFEIGGKVERLESSGSNGKEELHSAVTCLCTAVDSTLIAVAVQSFQGIILLSSDPGARTLSIAKVVSISGDTYIPTSLGTSSSTGFLWTVSGVSNLAGFEYPSMARVRVISGFRETDSDSIVHEPTVLEDNKIPWGEKLLQVLQGSVSYEEKVYLAAAEAVKTAMSNMLIKKQYAAEKRELRKRTRNDRKIKQ